MCKEDASFGALGESPVVDCDLCSQYVASQGLSGDIKDRSRVSRPSVPTYVRTGQHGLASSGS